jgi:hypothetical protein
MRASDAAEAAELVVSGILPAVKRGTAALARRGSVAGVGAVAVRRHTWSATHMERRTWSADFQVGSAMVRRSRLAWNADFQVGSAVLRRSRLVFLKKSDGCAAWNCQADLFKKNPRARRVRHILG